MNTTRLRYILPVLFLTALCSCEKDELPRSNPLDISAGGGASGLPFVADGSIEDVYANGAVFTGQVVREGCTTVTERGVCYNYSGNPSVSYYRIFGGTGGGPYQCNFSGLVPGFTYYVRAYAINGCGIQYGAVHAFTTPIQ